MQLLLELVAARLEARCEIAHGLQVAHQLILLELQFTEKIYKLDLTLTTTGK